MVCCGWRCVGVAVVGGFGRKGMLMLVSRIGKVWMSEIWPIRDSGLGIWSSFEMELLLRGDSEVEASW